MAQRAIQVDVGDTVGDDRYELTARLGNGAFGTAFEAHDHDEDAQVAVKLLEPWVEPGDVLREARLQRRLSAHPRIVAMRNVIVSASPSPFVVLDYVAGGSVQDRLDDDRPSIVEAQRWLRDVLEALDHAHSLNVLHRDVKPSNLLLGPDGHALLTDFGVAEDSVRRAAASPGMYPLTVPPEFAAGLQTTERSDLWLVGVLGWQLLVGRRPDLDDAYAGMLEFPHRHSLEVPMALSRAVMAALAPDPADRPATAARMLEDVAAVGIRQGWRDVVANDPLVVQAWETVGGAVPGVCVEIRARARSDGFEVAARAPTGARLRARRREIRPTLAAARQQARRWLEGVTRGERL